MDPKEQIGKFREVYNSLREEIGKVIVGQDAFVLQLGMGFKIRLQFIRER